MHAMIRSGSAQNDEEGLTLVQIFWLFRIQPRASFCLPRYDESHYPPDILNLISNHELLELTSFSLLRGPTNCACNVEMYSFLKKIKINICHSFLDTIKFLIFKITKRYQFYLKIIEIYKFKLF